MAAELGFDLDNTSQSRRCYRYTIPLQSTEHAVPDRQNIVYHNTPFLSIAREFFSVNL